MDRFILIPAPTNLLFSLILTLAFYIIWILFIDPQLTPLRHLPGVQENDNFILGHSKYTFTRPASEVFEAWIDKYGPTFQYRNFFRRRRMFTVDPRAIAHIMNHADKYEKPTYVNRGLEGVFGKNNILAMEGEAHRRAKAILNPCFTPSHMRSMVPNLYAKAYKLRDILTDKAQSSPILSVDMFSWLSRCTLDIIMSTAFDYDFTSMDESKPNELAHAFANAYGTDGSFTVLTLLQTLFKPFRIIPNKGHAKVHASRELYHRHTAMLLRMKQEEISAGLVPNEKKGVPDMLTALLRARSSDRLVEDEELLSHMTLLMSAGHETVATTISWLLHSLSSSPTIQARLRAELASLTSDEPSVEALNALPYLEAVVRETLRLFPAIAWTVRQAVEDDVVPVRWNVGEKGLDHIRLRKGDDVMIPILAIHRERRLWGEDAHEFRPERWLQSNSPYHVSDNVGMYANLMTFLGGSRNCIGYKIAMLEIKIVVSTLLRSLSFHPVSGTSISAKHSILMKPHCTDVQSSTTRAGLPLLVEVLDSTGCRL